jgi:predicted DNA-binding transcriptional regulator AlpA
MHAKAVLNSWKEVAQYVGRSTRTLQRWERELGFPIHRPQGKQRSAIVAIPDEIDTWIQKTPTSATRDPERGT